MHAQWSLNLVGAGIDGVCGGGGALINYLDVSENVSYRQCEMSSPLHCCHKPSSQITHNK